MRWRMAWAIPWLLAVFLSALLTQGSAAQDNLLVNGGFEDGTVGWQARGGELTASDAVVRSGSYAGAFVATNPAPGANRVRHCVPVASAADYEFRGYAARGEEKWLSARLSISWYGTDNCSAPQIGGHGDEGGVVLEEAGQWYELMLTAKSVNTARSAYLTIVVDQSDATVYFDDFAVGGPAAPTQTPTPEPSPDPSPSVSPTATAGPHHTPTRTATAEPRPPASTTPRVSPTASSSQRTPVPATEGLRNGGFEEAGPDGLPSFWQKYGGELESTSTVHSEGQYAAALSSQTSSTKWAYQIVTVQGETAYVLSAQALKDDPAVAAAYLRVSWYASPDASGQAIASADSTERLIDDSPEFRFLTTGAVIAPAEAASAKTRLMLDPAGEAPGTVYFDAVAFEQTVPPEPAPSPSATPPPGDDGDTFLPSLPSVGESAPAPTSERNGVSTPAAHASTGRSSPTAVGVTGRTPAALGAARTPVATASASPAPTRAAAAVYRQRKSDPLVGDGAATREESAGGGRPPWLLALALAMPTLAGVGAAAYYWRWRRARLR